MLSAFIPALEDLVMEEREDVTVRAGAFVKLLKVHLHGEDL